MPIVTFAGSRGPKGKPIEVAAGTSLYDAALTAGLPVASSCSAEATCGKCNMRVLSGADRLSEKTSLEAKLLEKEKKPAGDRISCITYVSGDCTVTTTYW